MAGGDYNGKHTAWGSRIITTKGIEIFSLLQEKNYSLTIGKPKLLEKPIFRRTDPDFTTSDWIPHHQFEFRRTHSTIQQCHRVTRTILKAINNKEYCTVVFLDASQAFDRVWHPRLSYKIKKKTSSNILSIIKILY